MSILKEDKRTYMPDSEGKFTITAEEKISVNVGIRLKQSDA